MVDDESSFRRRRRRDSDPADGSGDQYGDRSPADEESEEPAVELTPWWRTSPPAAAGGDAGADADGADAEAPDAGADSAADPRDSDDSDDADAVGTADSADFADSADSGGDELSDEPVPRRRSSFQPLPEPAVDPAFEPTFEPTVEAATSEPVTPAPPTPAPVTSEPAAAESATSEVTAAPQSALFKPRPDVERPWLRRSPAVPVKPVAADRGNEGTNEGTSANDKASTNDSASANDNVSGNDTASANESGPFSWSLTPNDELDPIVHASSSISPSSPQPTAPAAPVDSSAPPRPRTESAVVESPETGPAETEPAETESAETERAETERAEAESAETESAETKSAETERAGTERAQTNPAEPEPADAEPVENPLAGVDRERPEEPAQPDPGEPRPAKRASVSYDTDSLAFLMELEAAAAATSAPVAPDTDSGRDDNDDDGGGDGDGDKASAADARRSPVSAAGLPMSEFSQETFGGLVPPSGVKPSSHERERPERPERPERGSGRSGLPALPPVVKWVALGIAVVLVLIALFFLGTSLPSLFGSAGSTPAAAATTTTATPTASPTPTPTPTTPATETVAAVGPVAPGEHKWNALLGGECLEPHATPWAEKFTVVDCATAHTAQMVFTAPVTSDPAAAYPGEAEIASEIALWCSAPGVLDSAAAGAYSDLQVQGTYPVTEEQWAEGERNYYCFISRSTGEALTGTLAIAQPAT